MTRLAIIAPHFPEYSLRYAAAMARHCDVLVVVDEGQVAAEFAGRGIPQVSRVTVARVSFRAPLDLWKLCVLVRQFQPDIVHMQEAVGPRRILATAVIGAMTSRSAMLVLTVHDPLPHTGRDQASARRFAWMNDYVRRLADIIIVHGAFCASALRNTSPRDRQKLVVSDHGLILEPQAFGPPSPLPPLKLYMFGRMEAYKGIEVLLGMARRLHAEGFPFELTIAGRGPELDRLEAQFSRIPEVRIQNGFVSPTEIMESIQAADCIVLPYLNATQSGVLSAAFAGRRYVIASEIGGIPDIVSHGYNGLLVPAGDAEALTEAARSIFRDSILRDRLQTGAEATAAGRLNWERICDTLFREFVAALAARSREA